MKRVYIAGPLFNEDERKRSEILASRIEALGFATFVPHRDGLIANESIKQGNARESIRSDVFHNDVKAIEESDIILAILNGRVPDEGVCIELGMAHAKGKQCIGYLTDIRTLDEYGVNPMIEGCLQKIVKSDDELIEVFKTLG